MAKKASKKSTPKAKPKVYEFTVTLLDTKPVVWRKFLAHEFIELTELHLLIQATMGWQNTHHYEFEIGNESYTETHGEKTEKTDINGIELRDVLGKEKVFQYVYDYGDYWEHEVKITKVLEDDPRMMYPVCIGGENACPPEDCGGTGGFEDLKELLAGPDSEEKDEMLSFVGGFYNPKTFDPNFVNKNFLWGAEEF